MRQQWFTILVLWVCLLPWATGNAQGAEGEGTVVGTVTLDGRVTADVVVSIKGLSGEALKARLPSDKPKPVIVDQGAKKFIPRISAILVGTLVNFPNNDKTWHNVYSASETKQFDLGLYPPGESRGVTFDKAGVVRVLCNVHPQMEAFVVVKEDPYFVVPNSRGIFRIPSLPLGEYGLEVWHPEVGSKTKLFKIVRTGEVRTINVSLKKIR